MGDLGAMHSRVAPFLCPLTPREPNRTRQAYRTKSVSHSEMLTQVDDPFRSLEFADCIWVFEQNICSSVYA